MKLVTTIWVNDFESFENKVCLLNLAEQQRFNSTTPLHALVLDGINKLPDSYIHRLGELNVMIHDACNLVEAITSRYRSSLGFVNDYEFLCFIRWLVIDEFFSGEPYLHIDSDLYINIDSSSFVELFGGLSGTFGSPCLTSCASRSWAERYKDNFLAFIADPATFRSRFKNIDISMLRDHIGSDQDLIHILECAEELPNLRDSFDFKTWSIFINPLWPYISKPSKPVRFEQRSSVDHIDNKNVLFWHMQNDFTTYVGRAIFLKETLFSLKQESLWPTRIPLPYLQLDKSTDNITLKIIEWLLLRNADPRAKDSYNPFSRKYVCQQFIGLGAHREIFSSRVWWESDTFL